MKNEVDDLEKKGFIWNMFGSIMTAASTMILSLFVIKIVGAKEGGIFAIALTISQMLMYIAYYEMRTFQVTDAKGKYQFSEYHATKIIMCCVTLVITGIYIGIKGYYLEKALIVWLMCLWKVIDGYADVYESQFQTIGRLDLAGKSMTYRILISLIIFFGALISTHNLLLSLVILNIVACIGVIMFDIIIMKKIGRISCLWNCAKIKEIVKECFPLFVSTFCGVYILSASRMAIDSNMTSEFQAYYQVIFLPVSVVNLFANFVFKPLLPKLAMYYENKMNKEFYKIIGQGIMILTGITFICMLGAYIIGIPVLSLLSGCNLENYKKDLVFLIFAGGFNAVNYTLYYVLTIMRKMKAVLMAYIITTVVAYIISPFMVRSDGIEGAAMSFFVAVMVLFILLAGLIIKNNRKEVVK